MNEPSDGVPPMLLSHIHLVSTYRYPSLANVSLDTIVEYLLQAPRIVREGAPMNWMFLDAPPDGSVMLVWQPLNKMGTRFASDGYVWADAEQVLRHPHQGYMVEMYIHKSGYRPPHESMSTHCRRRYRLTPMPDSGQNLPACDPSLWIVHYAHADPSNQFAARSIPISPQDQNLITQRRYLHQHGQLVRKEFMLNDRSNWPTINLPGRPEPQYNQPQMAAGYPGNVISHLSRSQQQAYGQDHHMAAGHSVGPSPAKRPRPAPTIPRPNAAAAIAAAAAAQNDDNNEEDVSRGDLMDFLTPREISDMRYTQHHEWMEEVFSSPYATGQIVPVELGLGRKGELESLTRDFFEAPVGETPRSTGNQELSSGKLEPGKAEEFAQRVADRDALVNAEMEKLRVQHAKQMEKMRKGSAVWAAEQKLRNAEFSGSELDDVASNVESAVGKHIVPVEEVKCIQKGGLEEKVIPDIPEIGTVPESADTLMNMEPSSTSEPSSDLLNYSAYLQAAGHEMKSPSPFPSRSPQVGPSKLNQETSFSTPTQDNGEDVTMAEGTGLPSPTNLVKEAGETGDWVVVDKSPENTNEPNETPGTDTLDLPDFDVPTTTTSEQAMTTPAPADLTFDTADLADVGADTFDAGDFGDGVDFGGLDTAGEELAGYGAGDDDNVGGIGGASGGGLDQSLGGDMGSTLAGNLGVVGVGGDLADLGEEMEGDGADLGDLGMEDSAFGDAVYHTEAERAGEGDEFKLGGGF
ncbi:MAG: hypothetical protein MMC33_006052 [Icmadophila ericetorum]|nr:hypothetical protein [Icmadophila ericetorum]